MRDWNSKEYRNSRYKEQPPAPGLRSRPPGEGTAMGHWIAENSVWCPTGDVITSPPRRHPASRQNCSREGAAGLWMLQVVG